MTACLLAVALPAAAQTGAKKPSILIIWDGDIGQFNVSVNGMMGYEAGPVIVDGMQASGRQSC